MSTHRPEPSPASGGATPGLDPMNELRGAARGLEPRSAELVEMLRIAPALHPSAYPEGTPEPAWIRALRSEPIAAVEVRKRARMRISALSRLLGDQQALDPEPATVTELCEGLGVWASASRRAGESDEGLLALAHALDLAVPRPRGAPFARLLRRAAPFLVERGRAGAAASALWACLDILLGSDVGDLEVGITLGELAWLHLQERRAAAAFATFGRARRLLDSGESDAEARSAARIGAAWASLHLGQLSTAEELVTRLSEAPAESQAQVLGPWLQAAVLDARGRRGQALELYGDAVALARALGEPSLPVLITLDAVALAREQPGVGHRGAGAGPDLEADLPRLAEELPETPAALLQELAATAPDALDRSLAEARPRLRRLLAHPAVRCPTRYGEWPPIDGRAAGERA